MARAPYQVLVLPYKLQPSGPLYCIFKRRDNGVWQFIAGGGETQDPSPLAAARREAYEESRIALTEPYAALETVCSIAAGHFPKARKLWGENCLVIPEYSFAVRVTGGDIRLCHEHTEFAWVDYDTARTRLAYDSNKTALWELHNKLALGLL